MPIIAQPKTIREAIAAAERSLDLSLYVYTPGQKRTRRRLRNVLADVYRGPRSEGMSTKDFEDNYRIETRKRIARMEKLLNDCY